MDFRNWYKFWVVLKRTTIEQAVLKVSNMFRLVTAALTVCTVAHLANARPDRTGFYGGLLGGNYGRPAVDVEVGLNANLLNLLGGARQPAVTETVTETLSPSWGWSPRNNLFPGLNLGLTETVTETVNPRWSWGNWPPKAAVTETITETVTPQVGWTNPWASQALSPNWRRGNWPPKAAVTETITESVTPQVGWANPWAPQAGNPNWRWGNLWAPNAAITETVTESVAPRWGWGSNPWGQNVAVTESVSPSWGWGSNPWGQNVAVTESVSPSWGWGSNPWGQNVAITESVSPSWGWGSNPWGQNVAVTESVSPSWGWGSNPWGQNVAITESVSPSWGWGSNPWGQNVAVTESVSPSWGWGQNLLGSNAALWGANTAYPWGPNVAISNPWGSNSAWTPSAALTEVVNTGSPWGPNAVITETVNNPWGLAPDALSLNGPWGNLLQSLSINQPLTNPLQQSLQLQLSNVFGSPFGRQAAWQTFGPTIQETLVSNLIRPVEPVLTDPFGINTPALPYCSSLVLADDTFIYLLQKLNFVVPTGPQRSLSAIFAVLTALAESLAQGLDYDTAFSSESLILSVAELQPAAARDHIFQILQSTFLNTNPIRVLVNQLLNDYGNFNAADLALCDRQVDAIVRANPRYQPTAALVIEEGRMAQKFQEVKPELEAVALQGAEQQFLANAKYVVRPLVLEFAALLQLNNLV